MKYGKLLNEADMAKARDAFYLLDKNPDGTPRIFFENAGGSLRLKDAADCFHKLDIVLIVMEESILWQLSLKILFTRQRMM